eukprot:1783712-Pleurochrysis_carterae.AAC.2
MTAFMCALDALARSTPHFAPRGCRRGADGGGRPARRAPSRGGAKTALAARCCDSPFPCAESKAHSDPLAHSRARGC